jgi:hypothetical protein
MNCDQFSVFSSGRLVSNSFQSATNITIRKTQSRAVL